MPVGSGPGKISRKQSPTHVTSAGHMLPTISQPRKQRRPGPAHLHYGIPPEKWPDVLHRIEHGDSLRQIAKDYDVSYETIRRTAKAAQKQKGGGK
jgi:hypothetical protein